MSRTRPSPAAAAIAGGIKVFSDEKHQKTKNTKSERGRISREALSMKGASREWLSRTKFVLFVFWCFSSPNKKTAGANPRPFPFDRFQKA
jgi:hypothetical protein